MVEAGSSFGTSTPFEYSKIKSDNEKALFDKYPHNMQLDSGVKDPSHDEPDVLSTEDPEIKTGNCSFFDANRKFEKPSPIPSYLNGEERSKQKPTVKDEILKGLIVRDDGGLQCVDEEALKKQKGVLSDVLSQILENLKDGRGIVAVSLPVRIFEDRSLLERICDFWGFAPHYLNKAAATTDRMERFKLVISFALAGLYISAQQSKPFNPILGETYQATFPDGTEIYCEHISHHPPIASFQLFGPNKSYEFFGSYEFKAKVQPTSNKLKAVQYGLSHIRFADGHTISFLLPGISIGGVLWGDRSIAWEGAMHFFDQSELCKATVEFDPGRSKGLFSRRSGKIDAFEGCIYYPKKESISKDDWKDWEEWRADVKSELAVIKGSWLKNLTIEDEEYWNIDREVPSRQTTTNVPLPSDSRYREDLIWLKRDNLEHAGNWKYDLEVQQRWDRKNRQEGEKARTEQKK